MLIWFITVAFFSRRASIPSKRIICHKAVLQLSQASAKRRSVLLNSNYKTCVFFQQQTLKARTKANLRNRNRNGTRPVVIIIKMKKKWIWISLFCQSLIIYIDIVLFPMPCLIHGFFFAKVYIYSEMRILCVSVSLSLPYLVYTVSVKVNISFRICFFCHTLFL